MQKSFLLAASAAALATLAGCNSEPEAITVNRYDPQAEALKNAAPVAPPPMVQASRTYRCRDNSLVYIDFYTNNTATVRNERGGDVAATLTSPDGTAAYTADGYSVSGNTPTITYTGPGKNGISCRS